MKPSLSPGAPHRAVVTNGHSRPCWRASLLAGPAWSFSQARAGSPLWARLRALQTASIPRWCESARHVPCQRSEGRPRGFPLEKCACVCRLAHQHTSATWFLKISSLGEKRSMNTRKEMCSGVNEQLRHALILHAARTSTCTHTTARPRSVLSGVLARIGSRPAHMALDRP